MADFRQLALEFVLADDEGQQTTIAKKTANGMSRSTHEILLEKRPDLFRDSNCSGQLESSRSVGGVSATMDAWKS